jgi:hypothetical protein
MEYMYIRQQLVAVYAMLCGRRQIMSRQTSPRDNHKHEL